MNVRFFAGTKADYLRLPSPRNPLGLYFCADTKELFWADRLLTDGTRIVATEADLPSLAKAAEGITYFVEETRNGYVLSSDRTRWVQVIKAPSNGDNSSSVKAISFAGIEMEEVDGVFTIDRRCAREALGFIVPDGMEDEEIEILTKEYLDERLAKIPGTDLDLTQYYTKEEVNELIPDTSNFVTNEALEQKNYVTEQYVTNNYITQEAAKETYVTAETVTEVVETQVNEVVAKEIETKVETVIQEKIEAGELVVNANAINYDTWD